MVRQHLIINIATPGFQMGPLLILVIRKSRSSNNKYKNNNLVIVGFLLCLHFRLLSGLLVGACFVYGYSLCIPDIGFGFCDMWV